MSCYTEPYVIWYRSLITLQFGPCTVLMVDTMDSQSWSVMFLLIVCANPV